ncbi:MAG TPA: SPFH domain-containing protein [Thermoanaerobaculia bacterium]|nr:SPFH domain-containing protein [Thermoanaerobaculia bacterium]
MSGVKQILDLLKALLTWWVTVTPWEQALRISWGRRVQLLGPGIHLRIPLRDRIYRQSVRRRATTLPAQTLVTLDGRPLTIAVTAGYRIADLRRLYETLHHGEATISNLILGAVGEFVVSRNAADCSPLSLTKEVGGRVDLHQYGLEDVTVTVVSFAFVRTYRFITGDGHSWGWGNDNLDTTRDDHSQGAPQ